MLGLMGPWWYGVLRKFADVIDPVRHKISTLVDPTITDFWGSWPF